MCFKSAQFLALTVEAADSDFQTLPPPTGRLPEENPNQLPHPAHHPTAGTGYTPQSNPPTFASLRNTAGRSSACGHLIGRTGASSALSRGRETPISQRSLAGSPLIDKRHQVRIRKHGELPSGDHLEPGVALGRWIASESIKAFDPEWCWMSSMASLVGATWHRPISVDSELVHGRLVQPGVGLSGQPTSAWIFTRRLSRKSAGNFGVAEGARPVPTQNQMMHD